MVAARVVSLDLFAMSYAWLSSVTSVARVNALNSTCWTSGHCSCLGKASAFETAYVSPPCWVAFQMVAAVLLHQLALGTGMTALGFH